jgi:hypothetical protein
MKKFSFLFIALLLGFLSTEGLLAQENSVSFQAKDLQLISQRYTGEQTNWPIVMELASHDSETNTFSLSSSAVLKLQNFSSAANLVNEQRTRIQELISSGATIFAEEQLKEAETTISDYQQQVKEGNLDEATRLAEQLPGTVDNLENILMENRLVDVQAQITKKTGEVDKRRGLLGSWEEAYKGDLLKELDGLKTFVESFANLSFSDGSTVSIEPETQAIIRKSRIDKLDESADTEITLENGSLLAKLSASGKSKSKYILNAGPSQSELKSQNFYAEAEGDQIAKLTNYDGMAIINSNNVTITIQQNEGTIVEEGRDPLPPVKLLPAPDLIWASKDTIIYRDQILFPFSEVEKAQEYRVQYSSSLNFDENVVSTITTQTSILLNDLALGTTYVRVQASDELGLKGPFSETVRIIRNVDNKPPPLFLDNARNDLLFTQQKSIEISGVTEPNARLFMDGKSIDIERSGQFSIQRDLNQKDQNLTLKAEDRSGNVTEKTIRIIKLTEADLYNLTIQGASGTDPIEPQRSEITISGSAYPGMEVEITLKEFRKTIKTDSKGRWGITFRPDSGKMVITFKNAYSGQTFFTKTYSVQLP